MPATPPRSGRRLALISLASLGWAFSFGLGAPLASLWLKQAGVSAFGVGLNTSIYYLGIALAAPLLPFLMRRHNRACIITGMVLDALATALFPLVSGEIPWHLLRFIGGIGTALSLIPMETLINHDAPPDRRAQDFGVYAFCVALGIGLGALIGLPLYPFAPRLTFALGGLITLLAVLPAWLEAPIRCHYGEEGDANAPMPMRAGLLGLGTAWVQGFLEGGMITFLSIYLLGLGYNETATSGLMGGLFAGVILAQLPLACLADRVGRLRVLLLCHGLVFVGMLCMPWMPWTFGLALLLFVLGACCGALYPLGLALLGERIPAAAMARANAWYLACNCAGSLTGPIVLGLAIDAFGMRSQFFLGALAVTLVLGTGLILGKARPEELATEEAAPLRPAA